MYAHNLGFYTYVQSSTASAHVQPEGAENKNRDNVFPVYVYITVHPILFIHSYNYTAT
jgi:hypothetical protein